MKVGIFSNNSSRHSTAALFKDIFTSLDAGFEYKIKYGISTSNLFEIFKSDVVVFQTFLTKRILLILLSKLLRKKIILIVWDIYPESFVLSGKNINRLLFTLLSFLERKLMSLCDRLIVPSDDYKVEPMIQSGTNIITLPFRLPIDRMPVRTRRLVTGDRLKIIFGGQINKIRGVEQALHWIASSNPQTMFEFQIYSDDNLAEIKLPDNAIVKKNKQLSKREFINRLQNADAGLVCLSKDFDLPAFPSKIPFLVGNGVPIIYFGPYLGHLEKILNETQVGVSANGHDFNQLYRAVGKLNHDFGASQKRYELYVDSYYQNISESFRR